MHRILIVDNSIYVSGAIKSIVDTIGSLGDRYYFKFVMDMSGEASEYVAEASYPVHDMKFLELSKSWRIVVYPFVLLANSRHLSRLAQQQDAHVIHINDLYNMTGLLAKLFNRRLAVVYHIRLTPESYLKPIYPLLAWLVRRLADEIIYVSQAAGEMFHDASQATLIYDSLARGAVLPSKKINNELPSCSYLYVGNYVRGKGHNLALEAFAKISKQLPGTSLRFVGKGECGELDVQFIAELKARAAHEDLNGRVSFDGFVCDVEQAMKAADVVVNLSESESFSMVCLEALTYGLPLVASDCGGPRELVQNEVNGLLVENRNVEQAADAMLRLATEPGLAARLGAEAPLSVADNFSAEKSARELSKVYEALLAR
jgi:glycosyltransferase involved in cell wall biosynthesis